MSGLVKKILGSSVLAGAAVFGGYTAAGSDGKDPRGDLEGMVHATETACPSVNKDDASRLQCATVGQRQAKKLWEYAAIGDQFEKACTFNAPQGVPEFAKALVIGSDASKCLKTIENNAGDDVTRTVARDVRRAMAQGLGQ